MLLHQLIREAVFNKEGVESLDLFLSHLAWECREVSTEKKLNHKYLMQKTREYARTLFDDREIFIRSMNDLVGKLDEQNFLDITNNPATRLKCQIDKIYESSEMKVKLLKYLQGRGKGKQRDEIADHFNISLTSLTERVQELRSPDNHILGTRIQIDLERGTNLYDSTVHPLFLALNLSEVYGMLTCLIKAEKDVPGDTVTNILKDIISQLTPYAKSVLKESGLKIDPYFSDDPRSFRNESTKDHYYHIMKTGTVCRIWLNEGERSVVGKIKPNLGQGKEFFIHPMDGSNPFQLDCGDIKNLIEMEEA